MGIADRLAEVQRRLEQAARASGRDPAEIRLVAVSKVHPAARVREAVSAGIRRLGENRVQEAVGKAAELADLDLEWHLIGHLQKNKVRHAVRLFHTIHSVDSADLLTRIDRIAAEEDRRLSALIQVDLAGEATKSGVPTDDVPPILKAAADLANVSVVGLMTLPPYFEDPEQVRPYFRRLATLRDQLREQGLGDLPELSMGMTHDFEVAIAEGATMIRVGTAIFGARG